ncbi:unnamed protein product [Pylaiella littoralis]
MAKLGSTIDMNNISLALEIVKSSRATLHSWGSEGTIVVTPPQQRSRSSTSTTSSSSSGSANNSPCSSVHGSSSSSSGSISGGVDLTQQRKRCVRWSDECGGELVTQQVRTTDFWERMVFGSGCCCNSNITSCSPRPSGVCRSDNSSKSTSSSSSSSSSSESPSLEFWSCERCGELQQRWLGSAGGGGGGSFCPTPPSELFLFIEELSRGVEATLVFPGVVTSRRRKVILYTEDNGESICWLKTGRSSNSSSRGVGSSSFNSQPYRICCKTLLAVTDKSGAAGRRSSSRSNSESWRDDGNMASPSTTRVSTAAGRLAACGGSLSCGEPVDTEGGGDGGGGGGGGAGAAVAVAGGAEGAGAAGVVAVKLKWLPQPTWSKRSVKIVDVKTAICPGVFTRGLLQLLSFNTDLQN